MSGATQVQWHTVNGMFRRQTHSTAHRRWSEPKRQWKICAWLYSLLEEWRRALIASSPICDDSANWSVLWPLLDTWFWWRWTSRLANEPIRNHGRPLLLSFDSFLLSFRRCQPCHLYLQNSDAGEILFSPLNMEVISHAPYSPTISFFPFVCVTIERKRPLNTM